MEEDKEERENENEDNSSNSDSHYHCCNHIIILIVMMVIMVLGESLVSDCVHCLSSGADVIGLNCCFDPQHLVEAVKTMKIALEKAGYKKHLICQPVGFWTPDAGIDGYLGLPEYPFG